mmetsp:Transcript_150109/g.279825  ORF Transcript_150109/g.279825 Transcript_150109/m.279825 type:complete len:238 (+) Transcript_150109:101-814(+)
MSLGLSFLHCPSPLRSCISSQPQCCAELLSLFRESLPHFFEGHLVHEASLPRRFGDSIRQKIQQRGLHVVVFEDWPQVVDMCLPLLLALPSPSLQHIDLQHEVVVLRQLFLSKCQLRHCLVMSISCGGQDVVCTQSSSPFFLTTAAAAGASRLSWCTLRLIFLLLNGFGALSFTFGCRAPHVRILVIFFICASVSSHKSLPSIVPAFHSEDEVWIEAKQVEQVGSNQVALVVSGACA